MATDFYGQHFSDNYRIARSKKLIEPADGVWNIIRIPRFAFVTEVWIEMLTAYGDAGATLTVGWVGNGETADPDGFILSAVIDPDATGMTKASEGTATGGQGKYFRDASGYITITSDDNAGSIGTFWVFAQYSVLH